MTKIFWINVDSHIDRKNHMERQLNCHGYCQQRVSAMTPRQIPSHPGIRSELEYACLFSHLETLRLAMSLRDAEWALISEDDIYICGLFDISKISKSAPANAEVLQLTSINAGIYEPLIQILRTPDSLWLPWMRHHSGTQLYAVRVSSIEKALRQIDVEPSVELAKHRLCLLYTSPSPRDRQKSRMPSSA